MSSPRATCRYCHEPASYHFVIAIQPSHAYNPNDGFSHDYTCDAHLFTPMNHLNADGVEFLYRPIWQRQEARRA
jgi:hypothetical protein